MSFTPKLRVSLLITAFLVVLQAQANAQPKFSMRGDWAGSPDCPITFYRDDGRQVDGNCDNGSFNHRFQGTYASPDTIELRVSRTDPNNCTTYTGAYIEIINRYTVKYRQQGWNGCGVRTGPGSQIWTRR
jgi:hypothetical protein